MEADITTFDLTAIHIQLNELMSKFDQAMREGHDFPELKETYLQMKELECYIKALQWDPENQSMQHTATASWM